MISSTAIDLPDHRKCAFDACLSQDIQPIGMEHLPARDATAVQASLEMVDKADIYIGIYAWRYGWIPDGSDISVTEMEFNRALERKQRGDLKDILIFVMDDAHPTIRSDVEADATAQEKLKRFKDRARSGRVSPKFKSPEELQRLISESLADLRRRIEKLTPDAIPLAFKASAELNSRIDDLSTELANHPLAGRGVELGQLEQFLERPSGFLLVTGDAGYGKSALLAHWLKRRPPQPRVVRHLFSCRSDLTRSVLEFYRSTLVTLSVHWNRPLLRLPASEGEARDALFALLDEVRSLGAGKASPLLLVVDGLDEAAPAERWDYPFFPRALPEGMHIVVSVRLGDGEQAPAYLAGWLAQSDERLRVGFLKRPALVEWMQALGGIVAELADDNSVVNALLQKTNGLPLHLAFIFDDLSKLPASREDFAKLIEQTPTGFAAYVDLQFRRLVESPVGREQRWREFFGLLVAAKAELQREDINAILGLTIWDLYAMPGELHRWVAQRGDGYTFRNEALRFAFARLDAWPAARERLLDYSRQWLTHRQPYALRSLIGHLRDAGDRTAWFATATDRDFLKCQGEAFPYEPLMPLQTIEEAMAEAIARGDLDSLCRLIFVHAVWMPDPRTINPLDRALSAPALAWQQIKLAEITDPSTEVMWQLLVAWRCAVEGKTEEARRFLSQVATSIGRGVHVVYWGQILGVILPQLMEVDAAQTLNIALALLDTAELPRFLGSARPPAEAIELTQKWYQTGNPKTATGWLTLWRSMAEKGELAAVLNATRNLRPEAHRANALLEVSLILARLGRLNQLQECLAEIEQYPAKMAGSLDVMAKTRVVVLASIGSLRMKSGDKDGWNLLLEAEAAANAMPPKLPHQAEAMARVGEAWAQAAETEAAVRAFEQAVEFVRAPAVPLWLKTGTLQEIARYVWSAYRVCRGLHRSAVDLLHFMEELATGHLSIELESNFPRTIAEGWDELGDFEQAWKWITKIPNPQFRGKTLGDFVERRLMANDPKGAWKLIEEKSRGYPGWGLVRLGAYHVRCKEWDDAAMAFARAVQTGATRGGHLGSAQTSVLLAELTVAFELTNEAPLAAKHLEAAIERAKMLKGHMVWWFLLNIAERTFWLQSTDLGSKVLEEATVGAFARMYDPERVPLLCLVARVQHLVARQPERAQEALGRAYEIIHNHIPDPVKGMIARCEVIETLHRCGLDDQAQRHLRGIFTFADGRTTRPPEKADEVIAEAALGHARAADINGAKRLLTLLGGRRLDAATRAWAIIHTYEGDDAASEAAVRQIANENFRARIRRDLAITLTKLGRVEQALVVAHRIQVDRDNTLPWIAMAFVEGGFRDAFFKLIVPATRFPNATSVVLAGLLRLHPELAPAVSRLLLQFVPDIMPSRPGAAAVTKN